MEPLVLLSLLMVVAIWMLMRISSRLDEQDARWQSLLHHLGIDPSQLAEPSDAVRALATQPGGRIEAIKAYRQQTGANLKDAMAVVDKLAAQAALVR